METRSDSQRRRNSQHHHRPAGTPTTTKTTLLWQETTPTCAHRERRRSAQAHTHTHTCKPTRVLRGAQKRPRGTRGGGGAANQISSSRKKKISSVKETNKTCALLPLRFYFFLVRIPNAKSTALELAHLHTHTRRMGSAKRPHNPKRNRSVRQSLYRKINEEEIQ